MCPEPGLQARSPERMLSTLREALLVPTLGFLLPAVLHLEIHSDDR